MSNIYNYLGQYEQALAYQKQHLEIAEKTDDQLCKASTWQEQSLVIAQKIKDRSTEAVSLNNLDRIYDTMGNYDQALKYYQDSLATAKEIGDIKQQGIGYGNQGSIYFSL